MVILLFASLHLSFKAHTHTLAMIVYLRFGATCAQNFAVSQRRLSHSLCDRTRHTPDGWGGGGEGWIEECAEAGWNVSRLTIDLVQLEFFKYIVDKLVPTYIYCRAH